MAKYIPTIRNQGKAAKTRAKYRNELGLEVSCPRIEHLAIVQIKTIDWHTKEEYTNALMHCK